MLKQKMTEDVSKFINSIKSTNKFKSCADLIENDLDNIKLAITDIVIAGELKLEGNWNSYICSDVDVIYEEDMINFVDRLNMYDIYKYIPTIKGTDTGMICIYQFTLPDAYGGILDMFNVFHVVIKGSSDRNIINKMILMY